MVVKCSANDLRSLGFDALRGVYVQWGYSRIKSAR